MLNRGNGQFFEKTYLIYLFERNTYLRRHLILALWYIFLCLKIRAYLDNNLQELNNVSVITCFQITFIHGACVSNRSIYLTLLIAKSTPWLSATFQDTPSMIQAVLDCTYINKPTSIVACEVLYRLVFLELTITYLISIKIRAPLNFAPLIFTTLILAHP